MPHKAIARHFHEEHPDVSCNVLSIEACAMQPAQERGLLDQLMRDGRERIQQQDIAAHNDSEDAYTISDDSETSQDESTAGKVWCTLSLVPIFADTRLQSNIDFSIFGRKQPVDISDIPRIKPKAFKRKGSRSGGKRKRGGGRGKKRK